LGRSEQAQSGLRGAHPALRHLERLVNHREWTMVLPTRNSSRDDWHMSAGTDVSAASSESLAVADASRSSPIAPIRTRS
jgi:hypothetical protein